MKKIVFLISIFLFTAVNNWLMSTDPIVLTATAEVVHGDYNGNDIPLGDGEEQSSEEDKDVTEDDYNAGLDHFWQSRDKSSDSDLHFLYQDILFHDLELEVVVPPPKA